MKQRQVLNRQKMCKTGGNHRKHREAAGRRLLPLLLILVLLLPVVSGCGSKEPEYDPLAGVETTTITDSCKRSVEVPAQITRIAPSGASAQMVLMTIAPEYLVGLSSSPSTLQMPYFPEEMWYLPTFGQFYGSKANLNMESLIAAEPQIIIDIGDEKTTIVEDMASIQSQTGIPTIFLNGDLENLPSTYRTLGKLLGKEEKAEELASFVEKTLRLAEENRAQLSEEDMLRVFYGTGSSSLACNASGSSQADVIDLVGAVNAIQVPENEITNKGGGTIVNLEEVYTVDPDVFLFEAGGQYEEAADNEWSELTGIANGSYYEIPNLPYSWMSSPPSVNRVLGVWWLGNLLYPELYDYDMVEVAQEYYQTFWGYDLTREEAEEMLANSTLKADAASKSETA